MEAANIPAKLPRPWASDASSSYQRTIPDTTGVAGAASWQQGFPGPATFTSLSAGGFAADGRDMNGGLLMISAWAWWQAAGGPVYYDAGFSTTVGGYPAGAYLQQASTPGAFWLSTVDNNTSDPDTGGANWLGIHPTTTLTLHEIVITATGSFSISIPSNVLQSGWGKTTGGGGGAGGNTGSLCGGAGSAGGTAEGPLTLTPGGTISGTVGAGGGGGGSGANGSTGGNSSLGVLNGGGGGGGNGISPNIAGGVPGSASGGALNITGGAGADGSVSSTNAPWACGGASVWGGGQRAATASFAATVPGSGGGAMYGSSGTGGAGAPGIAVLRYWTTD